MHRQPRPNKLTFALVPFCWIFLGAMLAACAPDRSPEEIQAMASNKGEQVFEAQCSACHGPEGRGPSLAEIRALSSEELRAAIRNHPTAGQVPERLVIDDLGNLIEYLD